MLKMFDPRYELQSHNGAFLKPEVGDNVKMCQKCEKK